MAGFKGGRIDDDAVASRMIKENNDRNDQHKPGRSKPVKKTVTTKAAVPQSPGAPKPFGGGGNVSDMTGVDTGGMMPQDSKY